MRPHAEENIASADSVFSLLDTARNYARSGRYDEALQLLARAASDTAQTYRDIDLLDLQGRIYAQQGLYLDAERCWRAVLSKEPNNAAIAAAIERLRQRRLPLRVPKVALLIILAFSVMILMFYQIDQFDRGYEKLQTAVVSDVVTIRNDLVQMDQRAAAGESRMMAYVKEVIEPLQRVQSDSVEADSRTEQHLLSLQAELTRSVIQLTTMHEAFAQSIAERLATASVESDKMQTAIMKSLSDLNQYQVKGQERIDELSNALVSIRSATEQQSQALNTQMRQAFKQIVQVSDINALQQQIADLDRRLAQLNSGSEGVRTRE
jgi:tetratricopeptide (TPR) repeat protein